MISSTIDLIGLRLCGFLGLAMLSVLENIPSKDVLNGLDLKPRQLSLFCYNVLKQSGLITRQKYFVRVLCSTQVITLFLIILILKDFPSPCLNYATVTPQPSDSRFCVYIFIHTIPHYTSPRDLLRSPHTISMRRCRCEWSSRFGYDNPIIYLTKTT